MSGSPIKRSSSSSSSNASGLTKSTSSRTITARPPADQQQHSTSSQPPSFAPPAPPTAAATTNTNTTTTTTTTTTTSSNEVIDDKLLQKLDAVLGAAAAAAASVSESDAFDMVVLAGDVLMTHFDALSSRLGGDAPQLASPTTSNTSPLATSELRANISLAAAGLSASVEATRRCAARQHDLLAFADDLSTAGDDVRQSALHLIATLAQCAALPVTPSSAADDLLRLAALKADASRHWRNAVAATHAVRGAADRFRARLAANDGGSQAAVQNQAVRDLKAADERVAALSQQIAADKSAADAATKREAALKLETARLDALAKQLTSQLDAANAQVSVLEQQLTTAKSSATAAAAAAAAAAATAAAAAATPAAPAAATAATTTTSVVSLQNASSEQLAQFASDVSLKAKSDVLKEALRSASKAADELVSATLNPSSDVSAFVAAAKASAAAMTRPLQLAVQILTAAKQLPVYQYEGGAEDAELLVRYRRAIFDLISEAKRIRSGDEGEQSAGVAERDALLLEHRRSAVKMQLFFFGKTVEQVIYSGIWL